MYALRLVDDADVAEDLEQDAFLKAWLYIEDGGDIENFSAFMYRTVRNVCLSATDGRCLMKAIYPKQGMRRSTPRSGTQGYGRPSTLCLKNAAKYF